MQTNNQNSNSPINPKLGSSVTNAIKNAEAGELPALDDISNITNRVVEKIKASENILIALSKNPNIDEISAALGLAMILDTMRKHVTAIFSGQVPNVLQFLKPEETFEKTTNSLQDFIIALSKDKVDHISYKIEGDFVKVYVTPYKATIGQSDLSMSHGDYNVDLVICFNVISGDEIDPALSEYGRIMHDATAINLTVDTPGRFAELEWQDSNVSSISEMIVGLADRLGLASFSEQVATALLTGIVASTDHFSNPRTSSNTMSIASKLMSFGANQQLISSQIMEKIKTPAETQASNEVQVSNGVQVPEASVIAATPATPLDPAVPTTPAVTVDSAPVESIPVSDSPLDYIEIEPNPNQTLDGQPLESQSTPAIQSFESQISPITQPQEPQPVSQPAPVSQSFESQPTSAPQTIESQSAPIPQSLEPQQAPVYQAPINPAAAAASAVMENNFIQNPEPSLPQPNYTNETPNYQAPVMPTPPLNFAQNLATPQPSSTPFAAPVSLAAPTPLATSAPLTQTASPVTPIPQEQPMQYSAPVQPAQQIQPVQPAQFVQPTQYPELASPVQPMQFTAPVSQAQSMPYVEPMQPTPMAAPSEPVQFTQPVQPMAPVPPVQPMEPMQSMPPVPPAPVIFDAASMPNQPLTNDQTFVNSAPVDLMPPMPPMPPEAPLTPDVDFFAQAAAATEAAQASPAPISPVASGPIPADLAPVSTPAPLTTPSPFETQAPLESPVLAEAPAEPPLRTFASDSPLISQPVDTNAPVAAPIAEPAAIFSPEEPTEPAPAKIDPTAFHIPGM